jgi:ABC-2 type transport system permease protein
MKKVLVIIKREYMTRVRTRAFVIGTIASPLLMLGLALLPAFFATRGGGERNITLLDQSGDPALFQAIKRRAEERAADAPQFGGRGRRMGDTSFVLSHVVVPPDKDIEELKQQYNAEVGNDSEKAYVVLPPGVLDEAEPAYYAKNVSDVAIPSFRDSLSSALAERRLQRAGLDSNKIGEYMRRVDLRTRKVGPDGETDDDSGASSFIVAFIMLLFIYISILFYGMYVMRGVIEEKQSRIVEVLMSSVTSTQMMMGKLVGIGLVGLTQFVIWVLSAVALSMFGASMLSSSGITMPRVPASLLIYFVLFFILGYFLYATLYAMVGAMVSTEEEAQQAQMPVTLLIIVPMMIFGLVMNNPSSTMSVVLSMVPFFAPTLMMLRIAMVNPPMVQVLLSMLIMLATILLCVWVAARIYRVGILMYGKRPSLAELGRWLRYS